MHISQIIKDLLINKNLTQRAMSNYLGVATSTINNWIKLGRSIPAEYIIPICEFFDVTPEMLLTGKERSSPTVNLTADEQELLTYYNMLNDIEKGRLLERARTLTEQSSQSTDPNVNKHITTATIYSRSIDGDPPKKVIGDFSDIINAPDATDDY